MARSVKPGGGGGRETGPKSLIQIPGCIDNASIYFKRTVKYPNRTIKLKAYLFLPNSMLFKLINQTGTIFEP